MPETNLTCPHRYLSRRAALMAGATAALLGTIGLPTFATAEPTPKPPHPDHGPDTQAQAEEAEQRTNDLFPGWTSANGWLVQSRLDPAGGVFDIPLSGLAATVTVRSGAPAAILGWVIEEFHRAVAPVYKGGLTGYFSAERGDPAQLTNHASGTAVDIMPNMYPDGTLDTLNRLQMNAVLSIIDMLAPAVSWGGTLPLPQPSHFEIALPPTDARLEEVAARIRRQVSTTVA